MKLIGVMTGAVALRVPLEDVMPPQRIPIPQLIQIIAERYSFMSMHEYVPPNPVVMQNGRAEIGGSVISFSQLQMMAGGDIVHSADTDMADAILEDLTIFMDKEHGYRFSQAKTYVKHDSSTIIVEFEQNMRNVLSSLSLMESAINENVSGRVLKRLSFGLPDRDPGVIIQIPQTPLDAIEFADYTIDRRVGSNPKDNRFYCSAPLTTSKHVALLEKLEALTPELFS